MHNLLFIVSWNNQLNDIWFRVSCHNQLWKDVVLMVNLSQIDHWLKQGLNDLKGFAHSSIKAAIYIFFFLQFLAHWHEVGGSLCYTYVPPGSVSALGPG